jgi:hypothetical protein
VLGIKKHGRSEMDRSNICGHQTTHFANWMESLNVTNFDYNHKNVSIAFEIGPTICISLTSKKKSQVGQANVIGWKTQKCAKLNNVSPKGSPCRVLNLKKTTMKSLCWKAYKKCNGDGLA